MEGTDGGMPERGTGASRLRTLFADEEWVEGTEGVLAWRHRRRRLVVMQAFYVEFDKVEDGAV